MSVEKEGGRLSSAGAELIDHESVWRSKSTAVTLAKMDKVSELQRGCRPPDTVRASGPAKRCGWCRRWKCGDLFLVGANVALCSLTSAHLHLSLNFQSHRETTLENLSDNRETAFNFRPRVTRISTLNSRRQHRPFSITIITVARLLLPS